MKISLSVLLACFFGVTSLCFSQEEMISIKDANGINVLQLNEGDRIIIEPEQPLLQNGSGEIQHCDSFLKELKDITKEMEVLPLDIYALRNPLMDMRAIPGVWRADLTLERYHVFYRFKDSISKLDKKEIESVIAYLDEASPKEKSVALMLLYLFEQMYRPEFRPRNPLLVNHYRPTIARTDFSEKEWNAIHSTIARFVNDSSVAFPAMDLDMNNPEFLRSCSQEYSSLIKKFDEMLRAEGVDKLPSALHTPRSDEAGENYLPPFEQLREKNPENYEKFDELFEYLSVQYCESAGHGRLGCFNSSAKPKTVGDIAKRLLEAREWMLDYSKNNKELKLENTP